MTVLAIAGRELRSAFMSPLAWVVLAVVQGILGWLFVIGLWGYEQLQPQLVGLPSAPGLSTIVVSRVLNTASQMLLVVVPLLSMRSISEERRNATLPLLLSAPVSMTELVLGKYLALLGFLASALGLLALMPLSLLAGAHLDLGLVGAGFLGLLLLAASTAAAGLYASSLTANPIVAGVGCLGLLLMLWVIGAGTGTGEDGLAAVLAYLSLGNHLKSLLTGVLDTRDIVYHVLFATTFLVLAVRQLDRTRLAS